MVSTKKTVLNKPIVVVVHGFDADRNLWARIANHLENEVHFVIPDLAGQGGRRTRLIFIME